MTDDREMLAADFIVCLPAEPLVLPDNVFAVCCHCGRKVQHRPYVPREVRKLCIDCGLANMDADGDSIVMLTKRASDDIVSLLKRERH
jgi:hypothetical protein